MDNYKKSFQNRVCIAESDTKAWGIFHQFPEALRSMVKFQKSRSEIDEYILMSTQGLSKLHIKYDTFK